MDSRLKGTFFRRAAFLHFDGKKMLFLLVRVTLDSWVPGLEGPHFRILEA
jgi:hypothetical protein